MPRHPRFQAVIFAAAGVFSACGVEAAVEPMFIYNSTLGVLTVNAEFDPGTTLVSWLVPGPAALQVLNFQDGSTAEGSDWVQGYFDNKEQWIAITGDGINGTWDVASYTPGLDLSAFGMVEYGLRFSGGGGTTGFAAITAPTSLPGDLNLDGFVGLDDLDIVLTNWNQSIPPGDPAADPSGDGFVGLDDLDEVLNHWNTGTPPTDAAVPEPTFICLLGASALTLQRNRRRWD